jgi:hypothetical protein
MFVDVCQCSAIPYLSAFLRPVGPRCSQVFAQVTVKVATYDELFRKVAKGCPKEVAPRAVGVAQLAVGSIMPVCEL